MGEKLKDIFQENREIAGDRILSWGLEDAIEEWMVDVRSFRETVPAIVAKTKMGGRRYLGI